MNFEALPLKVEGAFAKSNAEILLPIIDILRMEDPDSADLNIDHEKVLFCYRVIKKTIESCLSGRYTEFDALTTTNCCHGISLFTRSLLSKILKLDLKKILHQIEADIEAFTKKFDPSYATSYLPKHLIELARLFILKQIKEEDYQRGGWRTNFSRLKEISTIGTKLSRKIVSQLQTYFSNSVAEIYDAYLVQLNQHITISGALLKYWGKYVGPSFIRKDKRGRKYAPCLYSMQVTLAYLIQNKAKVAMVNDIRCLQGHIKGRFIHIYEGNGVDSFNSLTYGDLKEFDNHEPIIVFGGCIYSNSAHEESVKFQIDPWINRFPNLVLACDTHYPQFPKVNDDPFFDHSSIIPEEDFLKEIIQDHMKVEGVSARDATLFCLAHIYTSSLNQINQKDQKQNSSLPYSFLAESFRKN